MHLHTDAGVARGGAEGGPAADQPARADRAAAPRLSRLRRHRARTSTSASGWWPISATRPLMLLRNHGTLAVGRDGGRALGRHLLPRARLRAAGDGPVGRARERADRAGGRSGRDQGSGARASASSRRWPGRAPCVSWSENRRATTCEGGRGAADRFGAGAVVIGGAPGAWNLPKGQGQAIVKYEDMSADQAFEPGGDRLDLAVEREDRAASLLLEYGVTRSADAAVQGRMAAGQGRLRRL